MKFKRIVYNIIFGLGTQIVTIGLGLIIPRLMLKNYGSEVNGLFTTISNVYTYLALVETGIGTSALQALYKPVINEDHNEINRILASTRKYYHKCSILYLIGVIGLTILLPFLLNTSISHLEIAGVIVLQGLASFFNFYILGGVTNILSAEGKEYIQSNISLVTTILTSIAKIILVNLQVNIVLLQLSYLLITLFSITIYMVYFHFNYKWISTDINSEEPYKLKQRGSFLIHNIVYVIFNNTDVILISIFCGLKVSSVYSVYNLVFTYLLRFINAIFNGLKFTLGQVYNENLEKYIKLHDAYKTLYCSFVFAMYSVCFLLITPFIKLYTAGITDIEYVDKFLPILFCLVNLLSACRTTENNLINLSFHARQTLSRSIVEAVINLCTSIILVQVLGVYGCLLGTIIALLYRTNDIVIYANEKILHRHPFQAYKTIIINFVLFFLVVLLEKYMNIVADSYYVFFQYGLVITPIVLIIFIFVNYLSNKQLFDYFIHLFKLKLPDLRQK